MTGNLRLGRAAWRYPKACWDSEIFWKARAAGAVSFYGELSSVAKDTDALKGSLSVSSGFPYG